ncbi:hypothetical protein NDU88_006956 [Pleurodeles waltl]|uniref:Uncharacterized protein n=1 Tax=Pleurodeles waltl TaxID=8319 RepID=A0AAV7TZA2_PLEWA|nr:hypothetical protein NDU88_006956 [Pleurodeles waltl]
MGLFGSASARGGPTRRSSSVSQASFLAPRCRAAGCTDTPPQSYSAARPLGNPLGSAVPATVAPHRACAHHAVAMLRPYWPQLVPVRGSRLRLRHRLLVPKSSRGPKPLQSALQQCIQVP